VVGALPADLYLQPDTSFLIPPSCLAIATIVQEAATEPYKGKVAVAKTIRNRMRLKYMSDGTVAGTVLRPWQFSGWNTQDPNRIPSCNISYEHPVVLESYKAWHESLNDWPGFENVVLYHADEPTLAKLGLKKPAWALASNLVATIGHQLFYKDR